MKVFVTIRMPKEILSLIERDHQVEAHDEDPPMDRQKLLRGVQNADGLLCTITDRIDEELLQHATKLKVIANYGVGHDHIDVQAATQRGILVTNTPGVLTDATADLTFGLILATARRIVEGDGRIRADKFKYWAPFHFLGREVSGKTLGIVGFGRIGKAVARRAMGFDMKVLYYGRSPMEPPEAKELNVTFAPLEALLKESDFVTVHIPLTPQTHHLISRRELELMKPSAYLINTARGPVIDEKALVEALRQGRIQGAGLDVYEKEPELSAGLAELGNVVLLPHVGSATIETRTKMAQMATENLAKGLQGQPPPNCLNWENVSSIRS